MAYAVRFEDVIKRYSRGGPRYPSLRYELAEGVRRIGARFRGEHPEPRGTLALDRVSFEVGEGEAFAIIGPNGAGKTTALKLVSRISYPTGGQVRVRGRVAALIEVGSGVHPELTARENIWLYGQILGMSRSEVRRRFDEIVDFAELGHVMDTPVKLYSSGMQMRLGFAIASHLDPEIFVVDEALAVGDSGFQAKCVERMTKLVAEGRTLLFVSHALSAVEAICGRGVFLLDGRSASAGPTRAVLRAYLEWIDEAARRRGVRPLSVAGRGLVIERVTLHGPGGEERYAFRTGEPLIVWFHVRALEVVPNPWFSVGVNDGRPGALLLCTMLERPMQYVLEPGNHVIKCRIGSLPLGPRTYEVWASVRESQGAVDLVDWVCVGAFRVAHEDAVAGPSGATVPWMYGPVRVDHSWAVESG